MMLVTLLVALCVTINIIASLCVMLNKSFYANVLFSIGFIGLTWHNYEIGQFTQALYFGILEIIAVIGIGFCKKNELRRLVKW
jgi:hypothetical protein